MSIAVVAFVGRSGSGKTTLICRLLPELTAQGVRVAVVKHSPGHAVQTDAVGSDTDRFWRSGAEHVVLAARDRVVHAHRHENEPPLSVVLNGVHGVDLVLLEGYKRADTPKVEVIRRAHDPAPIDGLDNRIAVVTDVDDLALGCPEFGLDQINELARFLIGVVVAEGEGGALG